jgi:hypothetical protein
VKNLDEETIRHPERRRTSFVHLSRRTCSCFCRCTCTCISGCHPRMGSASAVAFLLSSFVVGGGPALVFAFSSPRQSKKRHRDLPRSNNSASTLALSFGCHPEGDLLSLLGAPRPGTPFIARSHRDMSGLSGEARSLRPFKPIPSAQSSFQSTANLLTPTVKWIQTPTVRLAPDCTI